MPHRSPSVSSTQSKPRVGNPWIVPAAELAQVKQVLRNDSAPTSRSSTSFSAEAERQRLHMISRDRVAKWQNTLTGQRQQKLADAQRRAAAEEQERQVTDANFQLEEAQRRRLAIEHAKRLVLYQRSNIRTVHSEILQDMVLQERDAQIAHKAAKKAFMAKVDEQWRHAYDEKEQEKYAAQQLAKQHAHERTLQTAQDQIKQHQTRVVQRQADKARDVQERKSLSEQAQLFAAEEQAKARQASDKQIQLLHEMKQMKLNSDQLHSHEDNKWRQMEATSLQWVGIKDKQNALRKAAETKHLQTQIQVREQIGRSQWDSLSAERTRKEKWIESRANEARIQEGDYAHHEDQRRQAIQELNNDMRLMHEDLARKREAQQNIRLEENKRTVVSNEKTLRDLAQEKVEKQLKLRQQSLAIQGVHQQQKAAKQACQQKDKADLIRYIKDRAVQQSDERAELEKYVESVLGEPWMQSNPYKKSSGHYINKAMPAIGTSNNSSSKSDSSHV